MSHRTLRCWVHLIADMLMYLLAAWQFFTSTSHARHDEYDAALWHLAVAAIAFYIAQMPWNGRDRD